MEGNVLTMVKTMCFGAYRLLKKCGFRKSFQQRKCSQTNESNLRDMPYQDASMVHDYCYSQEAATLAAKNGDNSSIRILIGSKHVNVPFISKKNQMKFEEVEQI